MPDISNPSLPSLDLRRLRVLPLARRRSLCELDSILVDPASAPPLVPEPVGAAVRSCAKQIIGARTRGASVILLYGAHLLRNGAARILERMMARGWLTHLATNGAGSIHDWEFAFLGRSTESVKDNVANGTFGAWDETGRCLHLALLAGGVNEEGYGAALGRFIVEDGVTLPAIESLAESIRREPDHPLTPARADLLVAMRTHHLDAGRQRIEHHWKHGSIVGSAWRHHIPLTVHPGIGYDIVAVHPWFNGAVIGRAAAVDFTRLAGAVEGLDGGVVLSIGSAIMAPQVFEKSLSCVHNLRRQEGRSPVQGHHFYVVDLQDGDHWDWSLGEPPKSDPAYYLRFCKTFSRMGGAMHYVRCDNVAFVHQILYCLESM